MNTTFSDPTCEARVGGNALLSALFILAHEYEDQQPKKPAVLLPVRIKKNGGLMISAWLGAGQRKYG